MWSVTKTMTKTNESQVGSHGWRGRAGAESRETTCSRRGPPERRAGVDPDRTMYRSIPASRLKLNQRPRTPRE